MHELQILMSHDEQYDCGRSSMVEPQLPKLMAWVRFPSPAPDYNEADND